MPNWIFKVLAQIDDTLDLSDATLEMIVSPVGVAVYVSDSERYCSLRMSIAQAEKHHLLGI